MSVTSFQRGRSHRKTTEEMILDEIAKIMVTLGRVFSKLEEIDSRLSALEREIQQLKQSISTTASKPTAKPKKSAIEILKEQKVVFERDVANLKYRDALFAKLEQDGAVVLQGSSERVATLKEYLNELLETIKSASNPEEAEERIKDPKMRKLYKFLRREGFLIFYKRRWILNIANIDKKEKNTASQAHKRTSQSYQTGHG